MRILATEDSSESPSTLRTTKSCCSQRTARLNDSPPSICVDRHLRWLRFARCCVHDLEWGIEVKWIQRMRTGATTREECTAGDRRLVIARSTIPSSRPLSPLDSNCYEVGDLERWLCSGTDRSFRTLTLSRRSRRLLLISLPENSTLSRRISLRSCEIEKPC